MNTGRPLERANRRTHERGTALIVVIAILAILIIYAMGNVRTLDFLGKELRLLDQRQRQRIAQPAKPAPAPKPDIHATPPLESSTPIAYTNSPTSTPK
ncbi:MAG TPA: hypothetical protein VN673_14390 [Clostridia bacterium]|nr:hypothetical protein [Clostridia bacterium]